MLIFDITHFGAVGDGVTLNTASIQAAVESCRSAGGGTIRVPPGVFVTGAFELFSGMTLRVEKDGRLLGSPRLEDHAVGPASAGVVYARDATDVTLTGPGTIDGNAPVFFDETRLHGGCDDFPRYDSWQKRRGRPYGSRELVHGPFASPGRPGNLVVLARCRNVRISQLTLTGAPYWTLHCADCEDVAIEDLDVANDLRHPNNDGIHITSSKRVGIRRCHVTSGDDCIALTGFCRAGGESQIALGLSGRPGACEDVDVSDCVLTSHSAGVRIGYGHNPTRRIKLSRLRISGSNRGIGIFARQADVSDVVVEDCRIQTALVHGNWWGRGEPVHISATRYFDEPVLFHVRRVTLRNVEADSESGVVLFAEEPGAVSNVELTRVQVTLRAGLLFEAWGGNLDLRPAPAPLEILPGGNAPLWASGVSGLRWVACEWRVEPGAVAVFSEEPVVLADWR